MNTSTKDDWEKGLSDEINFWKEWLTNDKFSEDREFRLKRNRNFQFASMLNSNNEHVVNVLDLGSGPVSTLGEILTGRELIISNVDPLANEYNELLDDLGIDYLPRIIKGTGESLTDIFKGNSFDFVFSANALDHSYDPVLCVRNMMQICKQGGKVYFIVKENEGERQSYSGLHQWNFKQEGKQVRLWNINNNIVLNDLIGDDVELSVETTNNSKGVPMLKVLINV